MAEWKQNALIIVALMTLVIVLGAIFAPKLITEAVLMALIVGGIAIARELTAGKPDPAPKVVDADVVSEIVAKIPDAAK